MFVVRGLQSFFLSRIHVGCDIRLRVVTTRQNISASRRFFFPRAKEPDKRDEKATRASSRIAYTLRTIASGSFYIFFLMVIGTLTVPFKMRFRRTRYDEQNVLAVKFNPRFAAYIL